MKLFKLSLIAILVTFIFGCSNDAKKPVDPVQPPPPTQPLPPPLPPVPPPPPMPIPPEKFVVHFDFDSFMLSKKQKEEIEEFMKVKPKNMPILVIGYTDSQGDYAYNVELSNKRAKAVTKYLLKVGVKGPISYDGKGETGLLNTDKTIAEHKLNRRTEVIFILAPLNLKKEIRNEIDRVKKYKHRNAVKEIKAENIVPVPATEPKK